MGAEEEGDFVGVGVGEEGVGAGRIGWECKVQGRDGLARGSFCRRAMLGSSGQELLLWELRLVQERLNLKNSGLICKSERDSGLICKSEREGESVASIDSSPCRNDQAPDVASESVLEGKCDNSNVHECVNQLEGDKNQSNICNPVIYESESDEISGTEEGSAMDILPQRSEVKRHYPVSIASIAVSVFLVILVDIDKYRNTNTKYKYRIQVSIASDNFETMHLSEESSGGDEDDDRGRFVRNGFGRISTVSSRSVGGG